MIRFDTTDFPHPISDRIYLVGGCVRDLMLRRHPTDYDIVVTGNALRMAEDLADSMAGHLVILGKPGKILYRIIAADKIYDITAAEGADLAADLQRRDFCINAMAYQLASARIIDPHRGRADVEKKQIRMVSGSVFQVDPVRLIRAYRLAAELQFSIEPHTQATMAEDCDRIVGCPGERTWAELSKLLDTPNAHTYVTQMASSGVLNSILPELAALKGCCQGRHHHLDAYDHTLATIEHLEDSRKQIESILWEDMPGACLGLSIDRIGLLKMALLLHDIGKPATRRIGTDNQTHFYGHAAESARMAAAVCKRLRLSRRDTDFVVFIIRHHLYPLALYRAYQYGSLTRRAATRFFIKCSQWAPALLLHALADMKAKRAVDAMAESKLIEFVNLLLKQFDSFARSKQTQGPLLNGKDLINDLGLTPGPLFKQILKAVQTAHLSGELTSRSEALNWVAVWLSDKGLRPNKKPFP